MKKYYPSYFSEFNCLADKCPDSCCRKWEIVIDKDTQKKYSLLGDGLGNRIKNSLSENDDGEICFSLNNGKCPFLNSTGLCDIHIQLGEEYTSKICRDHPRFTEEYDGFTEISLSLSCPKTADLLFGKNICSVTYPTPEYNGDDEVLLLLISSRKELLKTEPDFSQLKQFLLDTAADDQLDIDLVYIQEHPVTDNGFIREYLTFMLNNCEILTKEWRDLLINSIINEISTEETEKYISANNENICKVCYYYIYRYYLKAVNDLDVYSRALFIIASCITSVYIAMINGISFCEAARLYSKETEHNMTNIELLMKYLSEY